MAKSITRLSLELLGAILILTKSHGILFLTLINVANGLLQYAQEQEFFRQTALISKKEKEKVETMKAVSFMYVRPPGYNAESAKAAEIADERKKHEEVNPSSESAMLRESTSSKDRSIEEKKKRRPTDVFGRPVPTEEEFEVLKNAPRLETGVAARSKPFGVEVRNVKCIRCGNYGHQSGDRECALKDAIMPNEESRLKRDDPLTAIMAQMDPTEPLKWELKQKPGMSPPRGGFNPDDPNQQIVAEDIFDEYGGFLGNDIPELLTNFPTIKSEKKSKKHKHKKNSSEIKKIASTEGGLSSPSDNERSRKAAKMKKKRNHSESSSSDDMKFDSHSNSRKSRFKHFYSSDDSDCNRRRQHKSSKQKNSYSSDDYSSDNPDCSKGYRHRSKQKHSYSSDDNSSDNPDCSKGYRHRSKQKHSYSSDNSGHDNHQKRKKHSYSPEDSGCDNRLRSKNSRQEHSYSPEESDFDKHRSKNRKKLPSSLKPASTNRHHRNEKEQKMSRRRLSDDSDIDRHREGKDRRRRH